MVVIPPLGILTEGLTELVYIRRSARTRLFSVNHDDLSICSAEVEGLAAFASAGVVSELALALLLASEAEAALLQEANNASA